MSGKKAQRTKGNAKPSSSSRAANLLQQDGQTGFIGFSGLSGNSLGYVPQVKSEEYDVSGDLQMLLRKMTKKDTVTKLKATQEFTGLCKSKEDKAIEDILSFWPRIYHKLAHDFDHRVREAVQQAHLQIVTKAGKKLAPHLKLVITDWLMSKFDTYSPSANTAKSSFDQVFPDSKKKDVFSFCKKEIVENLKNQILNETMDTLSDPKFVPLEEREAKFTRYISSSLHALSLLLKNIEGGGSSDEFINEALVHLFSQKKFWKFIKHSSPLIRSSFYTHLSVCCQLPSLKTVVNDFLVQLSPAVLTHLNEEDLNVVKSMWDVVLLCITNFQDCWNHVNSRKAVFPGLWKLLKNCGYGNYGAVYPNLLPFITNIPEIVIGDYLGFYSEFFNNFTEGLHDKQDNLTGKDAHLVIRTYMECIRYLLVKKSSEENLIQFLLDKQLNTMIVEVFQEKQNEKVWHKWFLVELRSLLLFVSSQTEIESKNESFFKKFEKDVWSRIKNAIIKESDVDIEFQYTHPEFFNKLDEFVICFCKELQEGKNQQDFDLQKIFNGNLFASLKLFKSAYLRLLDQKNSHAGESFLKLVMWTLNKHLLTHALQENLVDVVNESDSLTVLKLFAENIISPMVENSRSNVYLQTLASLIQLLESDEKGSYLSYLFQDFLGGETDKTFLLLSEIFNCKSDADIQCWLKNPVIQDIITTQCSVTHLASSYPLSATYWSILEENLKLLSDDSVVLDCYTEKLLQIVASCLKDGKSNEGKTPLLHCLKEVANSKATVSDLFINVLLLTIKEFTNIAVKEIPSLFDEYLEHSLVKVVECCPEKIRMILERLTVQIHSWLPDASITRICEVVSQIIDILDKSNKENCLGHKVVDVFFSKETRMPLDVQVMKFYSSFMSSLYTERKDALQRAKKDLVLDIIVEILCQISTDAEVKEAGFTSFLISYEEIHKQLFDVTISRCKSVSSPSALIELLKTFQEEEKLTEDLIYHCMQCIGNDVMVDLHSTNLFATVVSYNDDISSVRAIVEQYSNDFNNDADLKNNIETMTRNVIILVAAFKQWFHLIDQSENCNHDDYGDMLVETMDTLLVWKDDHQDWLIGASDEAEAIDLASRSFNITLIELFCLVISTNAEKLRKEHWDFLLCTMLTYLQTCEDNFGKANNNNLSSFYIKSMELYYCVASVFHSEKGLSSSSSCVGLDNLIKPNAHITDVDLKTDWDEFYAPAANNNILAMFEKSLNDGFSSKDDEFSKVLCACCRFMDQHKISLYQLSSLIQNGSWCYKLAACQLMTKNIKELEEMCEDLEQDENHEDLRSPPELLMNMMEESRNTTVKCLNSKDASINSPVSEFEDEYGAEASGKTSLLVYILSWELILQLFQISTLDNRAKLANFLHRNKHVEDLATCLFCIMPTSVEIIKNQQSLFELTYKGIQNIAVNLLKNSMQCIPAILRHWYKNNLNRNDSLYVDKFITSVISPHLLENEFKRLDNAFKTFDNMVVKTRPGAREVVAVYTVEEISMELVVKLAQNHPLSPVTVDCGKRIGVTTAQWRQWMLQLTTFLSFQNGTILDGLTLWKRNVDKRFEGVDECMICFSVIHGSNYSLPSVACKTCKKKFHPACLYKWFSTSGKSQCPLCRNIF